MGPSTRPRIARTTTSPAYEDTKPNEAFRVGLVEPELAQNTLKGDDDSPGSQYCGHSKVRSNPS